MTDWRQVDKGKEKLVADVVEGGGIVVEGSQTNSSSASWHASVERAAD